MAASGVAIVALILAIIAIIIILVFMFLYFFDRSSLTSNRVTVITSTATTDNYSRVGNNAYIYNSSPSTGDTYTMSFSNTSGGTGQMLYISNGSTGSNHITTSGLGLPTTQTAPGSNYIAAGTTAIYIMTSNNTVAYLGFMDFTT